jgi:hypothetical protein
VAALQSLGLEVQSIFGERLALAIRGRAIEGIFATRRTVCYCRNHHCLSSVVRGCRFCKNCRDRAVYDYEKLGERSKSPEQALQ